MSIILGIDPGTTTVWFAILALEWNKRSILNYWVISTKPKEKLEYKLLDILNDLEEILSIHKPDIIAIEKLFFTNNLKTWIDVAHARWAMIYLFAKKWYKFLEYTPLQVKKWICGSWSASKIQVQNALKIILKLSQIPKPDDAADALALAYIASLNKFDF